MTTVKVGFIDGAEWIKEATLCELARRNIRTIEDYKNPDLLFYSISSNASHLRYKNSIKIFYTEENFRPDFNICDYAAEFADMQYDDRYIRVPNYLFYQNDYALARSKHLNVCESDSKRKFCNFVYSNELTAEAPRNRIKQLLNTYKTVDCGGKIDNNVGGPVANKLEFQKQYKFSIAFENASYPGYTTEKILQAFSAQTVPIYFGNPDIVKEFNPKSFINCHDYNSLEEVVQRIIEVDQNDSLYLEHLKTPAMIASMNENPLQDWGDFLEHIIKNRLGERRISNECWGPRYLRMEETRSEFWYYATRHKLLEMGTHWLFNKRNITRTKQ